MICFKDKTFCSASCATQNCHRTFTEDDKQQAMKWWSHDPHNAPVAFTDFSNTCKDFKEVL